MQLLLVEDDVFFAQRISEFMSDNGFDTKTVRSAQAALELSLDEYVAAIVDVMLPNVPEESGITYEESRGGYLTGVAVVRRFRRTKPDLPIVLFSSDITGGEARKWAKVNAIPFIFKHEDRSRLLSVLEGLGIIQSQKRPRSFIVHGHDESALAELKDYLQNTLKWPEPTILREKQNSGKTIIEKFEEHAGLIDWVFVLITPDDPQFAPRTNDAKRRARQNVIFELGFFYGLLGRLEGRIIALKKGDVELPSDMQGIAWINIDNGIRASGEDIRREVGC